MRVFEIYFRLAQPAQLVNGDLEAIFVLVDEAFNFDEVVLLEAVNRVFDVVPHLGFDLAGAIAQG